MFWFSIFYRVLVAMDFFQLIVNQVFQLRKYNPPGCNRIYFKWNSIVYQKCCATKINKLVRLRCEITFEYVYVPFSYDTHTGQKKSDVSLYLVNNIHHVFQTYAVCSFFRFIVLYVIYFYTSAEGVWLTHFINSTTTCWTENVDKASI